MSNLVEKYGPYAIVVASLAVMVASIWSVFR